MTVDVDVRFTWWHFFISSYYLSVSNEISFTALKSAEFTQSSGSFNWGGPSAFGVYIFSLCAGMSLFDCFKWALIDCIVKWRGHSDPWQFQMGGVLSAFGICILIYTGISLYFLKSWLFQMGSHWRYENAWLSLSRQAVSNGGGPSAFGICILIYTGVLHGHTN